MRTAAPYGMYVLLGTPEERYRSLRQIAHDDYLNLTVMSEPVPLIKHAP